MADPTLHTVIDAIVTALDNALAGAAFEPDAVEPVLFWPDQGLMLAQTQRTAYFLLCDTDNPETRGLPDSGTLTGNLPLEVFAVHFVGDGGSQLEENPKRWTIAADISTDIEQKLIAAERQRISIGGSPIVSYWVGDARVSSEYVEKWVVVRFAWAVRYRKDRATR